MEKVVNDKYKPKKIWIEESFSFYKNAKILFSAIDMATQSLGKDKYNGICALEGRISGYNVFLNNKLFDISPIEIEIQRKVKDFDYSQVSSNYSFHHIKDEKIVFENCGFAEYMKWWESIKEKIKEKYQSLNNASSICQFARQLRNAIGHNGVNIQTKNSTLSPIWKGVNLEEFSHKKVCDIMEMADLIMFWVEFENEELSSIDYNK